MICSCVCNKSRVKRVQKLSRALPSLALLLTLLLAFQLRPALAQAQPTALTLAEYQAQLAKAVQLLEQADDPAARLLAVQQTLAATQTVKLPSGQLVTLQPLLGGMDSKPPDKEFALARIHLVLDQLAAAPNDNTAARLLLLEQILAQPEFNTPLNIWERLWRWLRSFLPQPKAGTGQAVTTVSRLIVWAIAGVGGLLLVFLLSYWLQGFLGAFVSDFEARRRKESGEEILLTASSARQQATLFAQAGNYRDAVRQLYLSALLSLEERHLLRYDRSLTNREVVAQMQKNQSVQDHLQPVVATFDEVWYGIHEPDHATFTGYAREIDRLVESVQDDTVVNNGR